MGKGDKECACGDAHRAEVEVLVPTPFSVAMSPDVGSATAPPVATVSTSTNGHSSVCTLLESKWKRRTSAFFQGYNYKISVSNSVTELHLLRPRGDLRVSRR